MCIGIPMQVLERLSSGWARVQGRGEVKRIDTALVGELAPGDWVLVFIDGARERLSPERAAEVNAALDLVAQAMGGATALADDPGFDLPSAMSGEQLRALTGRA